jgi:hypothetical protein
MAATGVREDTPQLLGVTVRRSITIGRVFLVIALAYAIAITGITSIASGGSAAYAIAVFLPVFAVVGSMGGMMVFTNDRLKGVFEYLIAYGVSPRRLFANVLVATLTLTTIVLGFSLALGFGIYFATGHAYSVALLEILAAYTLPMSYASVAFAATMGMFWTSLSSPRSGMASQVGLVPILGIAPPLATLVFLGVTGAPSLVIAVGAVVLLTAVVLSLLVLIRRLMPLERLLSPA